jgi:hypothetical protein
VESDKKQIETATGGKPLRQIINALFDAVDADRQLEKAKEMFADVYPLNSKDYTAVSRKAYTQVDKYIKILKGTEN